VERNPVKSRLTYLNDLVSLALKSKSDIVRFGAVVVDKAGKIQGRGWNRRSKGAERKKISTGFSLHAEMAAILQAEKKLGRKLDKSFSVYVLPLHPGAARYAVRLPGIFTCASCAAAFNSRGLSVYVLSSRGWKRRKPGQVFADVASIKKKVSWPALAGGGKVPGIKVKWEPCA